MPKPPFVPDDPTLSDTDTTVIGNIRRLMKEHPTIANNQSQLGRDATIDPAFISKFLQGKSSISIRSVDRIAKALGVAPWMLLVPADYPLSNPPVLAPLSDEEKRLYRLMEQAAKTPS